MKIAAVFDAGLFCVTALSASSLARIRSEALKAGCLPQARLLAERKQLLEVEKDYRGDAVEAVPDAGPEQRSLSVIGASAPASPLRIPPGLVEITARPPKIA